MKQDKSVINFNTPDLSLAAYLHALNYTLLDVDRQNPNQVFFTFVIPNSERKVIELFNRGDCMINAKTYYRSIHILKKNLFEGIEKRTL